MTTISEPITIIGAGGAGSRLAAEAAARLGVSHLTISNSAADLGDENAIEVSTGPIVNPTVHVIRRAVMSSEAQIRDALGESRTVIIVASLAGRSGAAIAPSVASVCKSAGKKVVSFAIMPFGYEKDRIFNSGIALKRLRESSDCAVLVDNDAILEGNPNLSVRSCYEMTNAAIMHVVGSIRAVDMPDGDSLLAASSAGAGLEQSLRDAIKVLYENTAADSVNKSLLYVMGKDVPVGAINNAEQTVSGLTGKNSAVVATGEGDEGVMVLSEVCSTTKFDAYDPLGIIPADKTIDWDNMESSLPCSLDLEQIEK